MEHASEKMCEEFMNVMLSIKHDLIGIAEEQNLTAMQLFTLIEIKRGVPGSMTMRSLAGLLHCDASNMTGITDRLIAHGLIMRTENAEDRRQKLIDLTPKGMKTVAECLTMLSERIGGAKLNSDEVAALSSIYQKINAN